MTKQYQAIVIGSCNLEITVGDKELAEKLLKEFPGGNRKLYPERIIEEGAGYLIKPSETFPLELLIPEEKVIKIMTAGGGANASKVLTHLGIKPLFLTSIGREDDKNYQAGVTLLKEKLGANFVNIPGRTVVGVTLNVVSRVIPSTLLIYTGGSEWQTEEFRKESEKITEGLNLEVPVLAIANSPPYLPLLDRILNKRGNIDYFCPGRTHISILTEGDLRYFEKANFFQENIDNVANIFQRLSLKRGDWTDKTKEVLKTAKQYLKKENNIIITNSERGGYLVKGEDKKVYDYKPYPLPYPFVDDTGAGDTFAAAFFYYHFLRKRTIEESIRFAAAFSTFPIGDYGAADLLPEETEAENWMKKYWTSLEPVE